MKPSDFLTELSNEKLAQYKTAAGADATKADKEKDYARGNKRFSGIVKATNKQFDNDAKKPKNEGYAMEDEQIDGMAQGEIREIIKNAIHIKNQLDKGVSLDGWMYSFVTVSNDKLNSVAEQINNPHIEEQGVAEDQNQQPPQGSETLQQKQVRAAITKGMVKWDQSDLATYKSQPTDRHYFATSGWASGQLDGINSIDPDGTVVIELDDTTTAGLVKKLASLGGMPGVKTRQLKMTFDPAKIKNGVTPGEVSEEWSKKYKSSINCSHPKGFSQKAHCAGKKKHNESIDNVMEMTCPDCGMCQTHGDHENLDEACWKGYHKEGNKKMFGKTYPNCVKNEDVAEEKRIPRKSGQPANSKKHSDLYTDENPKGTIHGLKFATPEDAHHSVAKIKSSVASHAHKIQAAVAMEQRAKAAGKSSAAAVYRAYINSIKKAKEGVAEEKKPDFMKAGNMEPFKVSGEEIPGAVRTLEKVLLKAKERDIELNYTNIDKMMQAVCKKHNLTGDELHNEFVEKHHMIPDDWIVKQLDEACWSTHKQVGMKNKGGKQVPNCVPKESIEEQHSESCPHCGGEMVSEELMNEKKDACYYKVKSRYSVWPSAYASGALVKCRKKGASNWGNGGKKNESSILEGIESVDESLHDWFSKEKWVRMDTKGNIKGPCAREPGEGKPKCLPQSKAHSLGKKGRASAAARKRREDPNPDRHGKAINVNTKKETKG
jgi:DNA-directed RNA polymerase subunit RPC12/RpoP